MPGTVGIEPTTSPMTFGVLAQLLCFYMDKRVAEILLERGEISLTGMEISTYKHSKFKGTAASYF
jgi:hypothetical protein